MAEPILIQQQRELLRTFRQATVQRTQAEVEAKAPFEREQQKVKVVLKDAQSQKTQAEEKAKIRLEEEQQAAKDEYDKALKEAATTLKKGEYIYKDEFRGLKMEFPGRLKLQKTFEKKLHEASSTTIPNSKHGEETKVQFENKVSELDLTVNRISDSLQTLYSWESQVQVFWIVVAITIGALFYLYGGFS